MNAGHALLLSSETLGFILPSRGRRTHVAESRARCAGFFDYMTFDHGRIIERINQADVMGQTLQLYGRVTAAHVVCEQQPVNLAALGEAVNLDGYTRQDPALAGWAVRYGTALANTCATCHSTLRSNHARASVV